MLELLEYFITQLTTNTGVTTLVPSTQIFAGPVDVATEFQSELLIPQINIHIVSEASRTVPLNTRDTIIQIDIWSRNNMLESVQISEAILTALNYNQGNISGSAHIFWQRMGSTVDQYEGDRRIWHRTLTFQVWDIKGQ